MGGVVKFVEKIGREIGRVFGIYSHDETFSDIQISNLLTEGAADKSARRTAKHNSGGSTQVYQQAYRAFQRDYRKKYNKKFLERVGYDPSSTAYTTTLSSELMETHLESIYGPIYRLDSVKDKYLTLPEKVKYYLQDLSEYDNITGIYAAGSYEYTQYTSREVGSTGIEVDMEKDYEVTQEEYLLANYTYNVSTRELTIGTDVYIVEPYSDTKSEDPLVYTVTAVHNLGMLEDLLIEVPVDLLTLSYANMLYEKECTIAKWYITANEWKYYIAESNTLPVYISAQVDISAIVPLKENNSIVNLEEQKIQKMLRKLNLSGDQLVDSLQNPDMDGAYLITGISPYATGDAVNKVIFRMFDLMSPGSGNVTISMAQLSMTYRFTITKSTKNGSIGEVGKYYKTHGGSGSGASMTLQYQGSTTEYQELYITNFVQNYTISGQQMTAYLDSGSQYCSLLLPLDLLNSLRYREFVEVYEKSLAMLAFSTETVRVKWYETGAFGMLLKIVAVVIVVLSAGSAGFLAIQLLNYFGATMALTYMQAMALILVGNFVTGLVISMAVNEIAESVGGALGAVLAAGVMILFSYQTGMYDGMGISEVWFKGAIELN